MPYASSIFYFSISIVQLTQKTLKMFPFTPCQYNRNFHAIVYLKVQCIKFQECRVTLKRSSGCFPHWPYMHVTSIRKSLSELVWMCTDVDLCFLIQRICGFSVPSVRLITSCLLYSQATRKWLENLYPSSDKRQRTAEHVTKRPRVMTEAEVEKRVREVVVARFYSLAKVKYFVSPVTFIIL